LKTKRFQSISLRIAILRSLSQSYPVREKPLLPIYHWPTNFATFSPINFPLHKVQIM
jgi:hypothetical protein